MLRIDFHVSPVRFESGGFIEGQGAAVEFPHVQFHPAKAFFLRVVPGETDQSTGDTLPAAAFVYGELIHIQVIAHVHERVFRADDMVQDRESADLSVYFRNSDLLIRIIPDRMDVILQFPAKAGFEDFRLSGHVDVIHLFPQDIDPLQVFCPGKPYSDLRSFPAGRGSPVLPEEGVPDLIADAQVVFPGAAKDSFQLHDIGKVREISAGMGFPYTAEGRLLGHITMSVLMVREAALELKMPATALQQLEHIILSHHGEQEKGSPMACATKEAFIVHYADEVNSIMNQFDVKDSKSNWEYNNMMKRYLMLK